MSPQISRTLLSNLADFISAVFWVFSILSLISNPHNTFPIFLRTVPRVPATLSMRKYQGSTLAIIPQGFPHRFQYLLRANSTRLLFTGECAGPSRDYLFVTGVASSPLTARSMISNLRIWWGVGRNPKDTTSIRTSVVLSSLFSFKGQRSKLIWITDKKFGIVSIGCWRTFESFFALRSHEHLSSCAPVTKKENESRNPSSGIGVHRTLKHSL